MVDRAVIQVVRALVERTVTADAEREYLHGLLNEADPDIAIKTAHHGREEGDGLSGPAFSAMGSPAAAATVTKARREQLEEGGTVEPPGAPAKRSRSKRSGAKRSTRSTPRRAAKRSTS